jgi:hypothetical protein
MFFKMFSSRFNIIYLSSGVVLNLLPTFLDFLKRRSRNIKVQFSTEPDFSQNPFSVYLLIRFV